MGRVGGRLSLTVSEGDLSLSEDYSRGRDWS